MQCIISQVPGNRCTIKHAFSHIFIRIQVGYTVQYIIYYIDILKSYLNLNKYMAKKGASITRYLGYNTLHSNTRDYGKFVNLLESIYQIIINLY